MDSLKENIKIRGQYFNQIILNCDTYVEVQGDKIRSYNPDDYVYITTSLVTIKNQIKTMNEFDISKTDYGSFIRLFDLFGNLDYLISKVLSIMSYQKYVNLTRLRMSTTFNNDPVRLIEQINDTLIKLYKKIEQYDMDTINTILSRIDVTNTTAIDDIYDEIINSSSNKLVNAIIVKILKHLSNEKQRRLTNKVEIQKDKSIGSTRFKLTHDGIQSQMWSMNLIPGAICEQVPNQSVIKINKSSSSPIDFNVSGLIDQEYIAKHQLNTLSLTCIDEVIVRRFATTITQEITNEQPSTVEIITPESETFTVVDTINGKIWRYLTYNGNILIHRSMLNTLLIGITTRPTNYNKYLEDVIIENYFDPKSELTKEQFKKSSQHRISPGSIKTKLIEALVTWFKEELRIRKPSTIKEVKQIDLAQHARVILDYLTGENASKQRSAEFTLTYLMQYDAILTTLSKDIKFKWNITHLPTNLFKEYTTTIAYSYIVDTIITLITNITNEMDKNKAWTSTGYSLKEYYLEYNYVY